MSKLTLSTPAIVIACLVAWPALRDGVFEGTLPMQTMLIRVGLALVFGMVCVAVISSVVDTYRLQNVVRRRREAAASVKIENDAAHGS
jgi:hypothetical protein